jgi:hypothetical protein
METRPATIRWLNIRVHILIVSSISSLELRLLRDQRACPSTALDKRTKVVSLFGLEESLSGLEEFCQPGTDFLGNLRCVWTRFIQDLSSAAIIKRSFVSLFTSLGRNAWFNLLFSANHRARNPRAFFFPKYKTSVCFQIFSLEEQKP